ncbi:MAG: hypothetical protein KAI45_04880, partial [Melioribacteraceae bacterium]|nr:hypothetical protein [Melioribacteraceae bacterium]
QKEKKKEPIEEVIIEKVEITDFNNMKFIFELDSIKLNTKLSEQLFNFKPTEGVEVIDLR